MKTNQIQTSLLEIYGHASSCCTTQQYFWLNADTNVTLVIESDRINWFSV